MRRVAMQSDAGSRRARLNASIHLSLLLLWYDMETRRKQIMVHGGNCIRLRYGCVYLKRVTEIIYTFYWGDRDNGDFALHRQIPTEKGRSSVYQTLDVSPRENKK
ncbi:hypothetical protein BofuT4_P038660.1 [Botrytis cinerea T4]|uniref:Uncharacterized protein n=1 Tax=Botryotinia fuckeliana (strain T4) TaxID=999810 RepID=G2Y2S4_BOTF4|nr:hypothetical protein BofuT4_P038660.1 [Botrytis cinerea T4]